MALEYASDKLKGDKDVVLKAVLKRTDALDFASDELKADLALKNLKRGLWDQCLIQDTNFEHRLLLQKYLNNNIRNTPFITKSFIIFLC